MNKFKIITLNKSGITDFAKERNKLLKNAKSKWVFFLDSDEIMSKDLFNEIKMKISTSEVEQPHFLGFYVRRKNYFLGQFVGTDRILRLGRRNGGKWQRKVHELWKINGKIGELKNPVIHETAKGLKEYISKLNYYSSLHAEANVDEGKKTGFLKVVFYPKFKFVESIIGGRGVIFSILQSFHSFLAWSKQWISQKK